MFIMGLAKVQGEGIRLAIVCFGFAALAFLVVRFLPETYQAQPYSRGKYIALRHSRWILIALGILGLLLYLFGG